MGLQATNAGIDFQQRVSAFMMILMEFGVEVSKVLRIEKANEKIEKIDFEACESIDDLVLTLESGRRIFFQMKRTISLSDDSNSEFYKVCKQFVEQNIKNRTSDIAYVLMTRSESSGVVIHKLRRVLDGIRLSQDLTFVSSLNSEEKKAFEKFSSNIRQIYKEQTGQIISDKTLLSICLKTYVETLDIEAGESFEKSIFLMLFGKLQIEPVAFWEGLIARAVDYGAKRRSVSVDSLKSFFDNYTQNSTVERFSAIGAINEWKNELSEYDLRYDNVVCKPNEKSQKQLNIAPNIIWVVELFRFENSEKRGYIYESPNMLYLQNGMELEVFYRDSTMERCVKYLNDNNLYDNFEINYYPVNEKYVSTAPMASEIMHKKLILKKLEEQSSFCNCINCGKAITDKKSYFLEVDNSEVSCIVGLAHIGCARPIDRIIGDVFHKISDEMLGLNRFDINKWIELVGKGKTVWESMKKLNTQEKRILVNDFDIFEDGNYCICFKLENGDRRYVTRRGKIERFGRKTAEIKLSYINAQMENNHNVGVFLGYSSESMSFCSEIQCKEQFPNEKFLKIIDTRIEPYNKMIATIYNDGNTFYAPIKYFSIDGEPLILNNGIFPLISDPLLVSKYVENWVGFGNEINDYEVNIIESDDEFILKISRLIMQSIRPYVNPLIIADNKIPLGVPIYLEWEIEAEAKNVPYIEL